MIETTDLTKTFDGYTALRHVNCSIPSGCIYGMVGSNGAGKSTFLRMITGVYKADTGTVKIDGDPVYENPPVKEKLAYVPDELFFLQGASMDRMAALYRATRRHFDTAYYERLVKLFRLNPKQSLNTFSKGMKRQAAIILAMSCRPQYLFFDETFDGLDPVMRQLVKQLICEDVLERKATAIITSHSLRELEDTCDQLALLHEGGIILQSDVQNLKTGLFKVQIAFNHPVERANMPQLNILNYQQRGSVITMIVRGSQEQTVQLLQGLTPLLLDVLPLTLEEVFTYEMAAIGYTFDMSLAAKPEVIQ